MNAPATLPNPAPAPAATSLPRWRRAAVAVLVALALVALAGLGLALAGGDDERPAGAAAGTVAVTSNPTEAPETPEAPVTPAPVGPTDVVTELPPSLPPVALTETAAAGNGVTAHVVAVEAIDGRATGPGNVNGPALRVTVRIDNQTGAPVSLDAVATDLAYGPDLTPASPLEDPSQAPFTGTVDAGSSADGVYVFSIPAGARDAVTLSVGYQAGAPFMVFTGAAR